MDLIDHEQGAKEVIQECLLEGENTIEIGMEIETVFISEVKEGNKIVFRTNIEEHEEMVVSEAGKKEGPFENNAVTEIKLETIFILTVKEGDKIVFGTINERHEEIVVSKAE